MTLKKNESKIDIYLDIHYLNKLYAKNIKLDKDTLELDFIHYSKRKRKNLSDSDFTILEKRPKDINTIQILDSTIVKKLNNSTVPITKITLKINENKNILFDINNTKKDINLILYKVSLLNKSFKE